MIHNYFHEEMLDEAKQDLKKGLLAYYSKKIYKDIIKKNGAGFPNFFDSWDSGIRIIPKDQEVHPEFVVDVNLMKIRELIVQWKNTDSEVYSFELGIGLPVQTEYKDNFIWQQDISITDDEKRVLKRSLITTIDKNSQIEINQALSFFEEKLEEFAKDGKYKKIIPILNSYIELYELQIKTEKKVNE